MVKSHSNKVSAQLNLKPTILVWSVLILGATVFPLNVSASQEKQATSNEQIQTTSTAATTQSKYQIGDRVRIADWASNETNGYDLNNHHGWIGTITSQTPITYSNSAWEYRVTFTNGDHNDHVAEQDLVNAEPARYNIGNRVRIADWASNETNGYDLNNRHGWLGTITSQTPVAYSNSAWEYQVTFTNGDHNDHVAEQDILEAHDFFDKNQVVNWFYNHRGTLTYSMYGSRTGNDGTADCSGAVVQAIHEAGGQAPAYIYNTDSIHDYLTQNGYLLQDENQAWKAERGDIVIWGRRGSSGGSNGHIMVICQSDDEHWNGAREISVDYSTQGAKGSAVQEYDYNHYANYNGNPYFYVYRH
ncbi:peptidoglycan amidohydrolase family protein [Fructobacillus ficulneus]|uniref:Lysin n=1 Tax=Fructobacillus ficulneus TaxID=157463 RepID=A0A0K8MJ43_9LACO|nr:peptidoglycan amidohydrolase family protein [Fructobacillus ficulneus]GAP00597.1 lysin [Fructobacillus ficulneus]